MERGSFCGDEVLDPMSGIEGSEGGFRDHWERGEESSELVIRGEKGFEMGAVPGI